jgi:hypothetical protein
MKLSLLTPSSLLPRLSWLCLLISVLGFNANAQNWPQWGGPQRNFMVEVKGLAETWPAAGPKRLWSRELLYRTKKESDLWS